MEAARASPGRGGDGELVGRARGRIVIEGAGTVGERFLNGYGAWLLYLFIYKYLFIK